MTESGSEDQEAELEARVDHALADALRTQPLSTEALARMHAATAREWMLATKAGRSAGVRRRLQASLVAALVIVSLAALWYFRPLGDSAPFGVIARTEAGDIDVRFEIVRQRALQVGETLRTGDTLTTHGPVLVSLQSGGTIRIAAGTVMAVTADGDALLRRGQIYVDLPPGTTMNWPFGVRTRVGTIEHIGTAFEVLSNDEAVRVRVREGRVRLRGQTEEVIAEAGTELTSTYGGVVSRRSVSTYGRDWLWVAALAPDYEIEGHPLLGFLEWASRELGRPLKFHDLQAREVAERTILHGSVRGRDPLDALASVLSTTSLSYEIRGDTIWIQSAHGT